VGASTERTIQPGGGARQPVTDDDATMSLVEHLEELRRRIVIVALTVLAGAVAGFFVSEPIIGVLRTTLPDGTSVIQTTVGEAFAVRLRLALMLGVAVAMPVILFQLWAFVTPGLTRSERRLVWPLLGAALALFALGLWFGYLVIPLATNFLLDLSLPDVPPLLGLAEYIGFVTTLMLAFGLALQFPVVLFLLARTGILSYRFLSRRRRWAILVIVLFAIIATPGGDPISSAFLSLIMYGLFEGTLQLIRATSR
jgi:sec-independent protein translocase protein TatC